MIVYNLTYDYQKTLHQGWIEKIYKVVVDRIGNRWNY